MIVTIGFVLFLAVLVVAQFVNDPCAPGGPPRPPGLICGTTELGPQSKVGNTGGITASSSFDTCSAYSSPQGQQLSCADGEQLTVLDLSLTPGSGQEVTYNFNLIKQPNTAGSTTTLNPGSSGSCKGDGNCSPTEPVKVKVRTSDSVIYYQLRKTNLRVPYTNTPHHSNNFQAAAETGTQCQAATLSGTNTRYENQDTITNGFKYKQGVEFTGMVSPPIEPNSRLFAIQAFTWQMDGIYELMGSQCRQPFTGANPLTNGAINCNPIINGYQCTATNPTNNVAQKYGMVQVDPSMRPYSKGLVLPASPYSRYDVYDYSTIQNVILNNNILPFADNFAWEISQNSNQLWDTCLRKYSGGRLSNRSPGQMWAGTYFYYGYVRNADYYYHWKSGIVTQLTNLEVVDDPNGLYVGDVRPVIIGCGYDWMFPSTNCLQPVPPVNGGEFKDGMPWPYIGSRRKNQQVTCSSDDDDCLGTHSTILPDIGQNEPAASINNLNNGFVPMSICRGLEPPVALERAFSITGGVLKVIDLLNKFASVISVTGSIGDTRPNGFFFNGIFYCSADRIGVWETNTWAMTTWLQNAAVNQLGPVTGAIVCVGYYILDSVNVLIGLFGATDRDRYPTADTMGTIGPNHCVVYEIVPGALPMYAVSAVLTSNDIDQTVKDNITIINSPSNFVCSLDQNDQTTSDNLPGQMNVIGGNQEMYMKIIGYETVTGKIGPDLAGYIVVCNATDPSVGIYQSDPDPNFPQMPMNPWYSNLCENGERGGRCRFMEPNRCNKAGKTTLPFCLAARPPMCGNGQPGPYNPYVYWYYVPPRKMNQYGEGCGQLGMPSSRFSEPDFAQGICSSSRNRCVPGAVEGYDWTLYDRLNDQLNTTQTITSVTGKVYSGSNAKEKALRDSLPVHPPCVITGYLNEWLSEPTCADFLSTVNRQGYLPPNFVVSQGDGKCSLPNFAIDGDRLLYFGQPNANTLSNIRIQIGVAGQATSVESTVSSGAFVNKETASCGVQQGGVGRAAFTVKNTGTLVGRYTIKGTCTNGIKQTGDISFALDPKQQNLVQVNLKQSGFDARGQPGICSFNLSSPTVPQLGTFDEIIDLKCIISRFGDTTGPVVQLPDVNVISCAADNSSDCKFVDLVDYLPPDDEGTTVAGYLLFIAAYGVSMLLLFITVFILAMVFKQSS